MQRIYKRLDTAQYYWGRKELAKAIGCSPANISNVQKNKIKFVIKGIEIEEVPFASNFNEQWKNIDPDGIYQVSSYGRVKRHYKNKLDKLVTPNTVIYGYQQVQLSFYGKRTLCLVHRLVAQAFLPNPNKLSYVNHKNKKTNDNRVENLEWVTARENNRHAREYSLMRIKKLALDAFSTHTETTAESALKEILKIIKQELKH